METDGLVFGITSYSGAALQCSLVILPRSVLAYQAEQWGAVGCSTWGELRRTCTAELYEEVLSLAGYGTLEQFGQHMAIGNPLPVSVSGSGSVSGIRGEATPPGDETPFDAWKDLPGCADGDWPPSRFQLMLDHVPNEIIERFGTVYTTIFNGDCVEFDARRRGEILVVLNELGESCDEDQILVEASDPI